MLYAHTVQKIAESCSDQAALQYDDNLGAGGKGTLPLVHASIKKC